MGQLKNKFLASWFVVPQPNTEPLNFKLKVNYIPEVPMQFCGFSHTGPSTASGKGAAKSSSVLSSAAEETAAGGFSKLERIQWRRMGLEAGKEIRSGWVFPGELKLQTGCTFCQNNIALGLSTLLWCISPR